MIFVLVVGLEVSRSQPRCLFAFLSLVGVSHALFRVGRRSLSFNFLFYFFRIFSSTDTTSKGAEFCGGKVKEWGQELCLHSMTPTDRFWSNWRS